MERSTAWRITGTVLKRMPRSGSFILGIKWKSQGREVGPEMPERGSKKSRVPVVWATFGIFWRDPSDFLSGAIGGPRTELGYITMTRRRSNNQWSGGIAAYPSPKNSECKNPLEKFSPRFFGINMASLHWLSSKGPNYQREVLLISAGAIEGHFEGKTPREVHQGGLVLARQRPGSPGTFNPEEAGLSGLPVSWSPTLFSGSGPVGLPPVPWTEKTIESSPFFFWRGGHFCREDLVRRTTF